MCALTELEATIQPDASRPIISGCSGGAAFLFEHREFLSRQQSRREPVAEQFRCRGIRRNLPAQDALRQIPRQSRLRGVPEPNRGRPHAGESAVHVPEFARERIQVTDNLDFGRVGTALRAALSHSSATMGGSLPPTWAWRSWGNISI